MNGSGVGTTLWDSSDDPPDGRGLVYCWNGWAESDDVHSLLRYVETNGERLRRHYLAWIHQLGESRVSAKRLIDHLALEDGLSFWWMTLFVEKSLWKSSAITAAIRIFALEEIITRQRPSTFRLVSANRDLHDVLSGLCRNLGIPYEWERLPDKSRRELSSRGVYQALPQPVQALLSLVRYVWDRWPLRQAATEGWFDGDRTLFCCSYFFHLDQDAYTDGTHHSYFWGSLPRLLRDGGYQVNWLQHYFASSVVPRPNVAIDGVIRFNHQREEQGFHTFVDAYLSWSVVVRVLARWARLNIASWHLRGITSAFQPEGTQFSLWPLMRRDWQTSISGPVAMSNLLWIELFDAVCKRLPNQQKGLYLCENQAWERALIHAWRKHGHGQLIAVPHSTVRFWDLRFFSDPRTVRSSDPNPVPQADVVALNGKAAVDAYLSGGHPKETIVECEALRYGGLQDLRAWPHSKRARGDAINVLILGDFKPSGTIKMLRLLEVAASHISARASYTVKCHPGFIVHATQYPSLQLNVVMEPLANLLRDGDFDVAYCGNMTSASVDASLAGLPVVVMLDETELNFSALRGRSGASFVSSAEELADALQTADRVAAVDPQRDTFFFLDPELPRWKRILSLASASVNDL